MRAEHVGRPLKLDAVWRDPAIVPPATGVVDQECRAWGARTHLGRCSRMELWVAIDGEHRHARVTG